MTLLVLIIGIVVISGLAASMASFYNTSTVAGINDIGYLNAYYLAESGVRYAKLKQLDVNSDSNPCYTYSIGSSGNSIKIVVDKDSGTTSTGIYSANSSFKSTRVINDSSYKGPNSSKITYPTNASYSASTFGLSGTYSGDYISSDFQLNGGVNIDGSLIYLGTTAACLNIYGNRVGKLDGTDIICSKSCIYVGGNVKIYGTVTAAGNITVDSGTITGDVYAGGDVSITKWRGKIDGNVFLYGTIDDDSKKFVTGKITYLTKKPDSCTNYGLPSHQKSSSPKPDPNYTGTYTFVGTDSLSDVSSYAFESFTTGRGASTCFDLSKDNTYINIIVNSNLSFNSSIYIKTDSSDCFSNSNKLSLSTYNTEKFIDAAKRIYIDVNGTSSFSGDGHGWVGTLFSQGSITENGTFYVTGAVYSNTSINSANAGSNYFYFSESDYVATYWKF